MAKKSTHLEELIYTMKEFDYETEDIETLELDEEFIQNIYDNAVFIIDEMVNGYVLHLLESIFLLVNSVYKFNQQNKPMFNLDLFEIKKVNVMSIYSLKDNICEVTEL